MIAGVLLGGLVVLAGSARAGDAVVPLARPGPWPGVSGLIGYAGRVWFVNSVKFVDHNSADVYGYDPATGTTRYERHLFSQDAGEPAVADGRLYWPFEDARFSTGRGEYAVTNGRDWQWRVLPHGEVFHVHAMLAHRGVLFAATSAWHAGLQRSDDGGASWRVVYEHPTPPRQVSRLTTLATLREVLYAGLSPAEDGPTLLALAGDTLRPVTDWPAGAGVESLRAYRGWLYGVLLGRTQRAVWRTDGRAVERVAGLDGVRVRALAAGPDAMWAVSIERGGGALWRSADGVAWRRAQQFPRDEPLDVTVYGGRVYVGTLAPSGPGTLWGPPAPAPTEPTATPAPLPRAIPALAPADVPGALEALDRALADPAGYAAHAARLHGTLEPLAFTATPDAGQALARRLAGSFPRLDVTLFGGALTVPATRMAHWQLLWAMAQTGYGRVPPGLLTTPWSARPNRAEKYLEPVPAAAWAAAQLGQADEETLTALVGRLGSDHPRWLDGDLVGALTALTGQRFGHDLTAWRRWWAGRSVAR